MGINEHRAALIPRLPPPVWARELNDACWSSRPPRVLPVPTSVSPCPCPVHNVQKAARSRPYPLAGAGLVPLDNRAVIEALGARYARAGEAPFDEAASRFIVAVCAVAAHIRGSGLA